MCDIAFCENDAEFVDCDGVFYCVECRDSAIMAGASKFFTKINKNIPPDSHFQQQQEEKRD